MGLKSFLFGGVMLVGGTVYPQVGGVDDLLQQLVQNKFNEQGQEKLRKMGKAAVPDILIFLKSTKANDRLAALSMLQYVWAPEALAPVKNMLKHPEDRFVFFAIQALRAHQKPEDLAQLLKPVLLHPNSYLTSPAIDALESTEPSLQRLLDYTKKSSRRQYAVEFLPRYHSRKLTPITLEMLKAGKTDEKVCAITSLIHQNVSSTTVRRLVLKELQNQEAVVRDRVGEYFSWHGRAADKPALKTAISRSADIYERASLEAAIAAIDRRTRVDDTEAQTVEIGEGKGSEKDVPRSRKEAYCRYRDLDDLEPMWQFGATQGTRPYYARCRARLLLQAYVFVFPYQPGKVRIFKEPVDMGTTSAFVGPMRGYFDPERKTFGMLVPKEWESPFSGSQHVGDDMAWDEDHSTVVSIGNGVVRMVDQIESWVGS